MKRTNERILDTALDLFNARGLSQVTLRTIAKEMTISQGNLNYHYKKREDIIEALYYRLVRDMDACMAEISISKIGLQLLHDISKAMMTNAYYYRFFFLDFAQIMRENKTIKAHYLNLVGVRQEQVVGLFNMMMSEGLMRKEVLPNEYIHLYKRIQIFSDFWMSSAEIEKTRILKGTITEYLEMIIQSIYPYLTDRGIKHYELLGN